jgi:hypothetical protein
MSSPRRAGDLIEPRRLTRPPSRCRPLRESRSSAFANRVPLELGDAHKGAEDQSTIGVDVSLDAFMRRHELNTERFGFAERVHTSPVSASSQGG